MKTYWIENSKGRLEFEELANIAYPCPTCGIPACGSEDVFWNEKLQCIVLQGSFFDTLLEQLVKKIFEEKKQLSAFLNQWNLCEGWTDNIGYKVEVKEVLETLELLDDIEVDEYLKEYLVELKKSFKLLVKNTHESYLKVDRG